jgi:hypothetical protein
MTHSHKSEDRDEVLFAFHQECARPTSDQIIAWTKRFPQFAEDIRAHAAVAWDWLAAGREEPVEVDENLSARAYSQALNLIFGAEHPAAVIQSTGAGQTFQEMLRGTGKEVYQLARELDIDRGVLADLFNGWMSQPICRRLIDRVISSLNTTIDGFNSALQYALQHPHLGYAKANRTPAIVPRKCEEIIRESSMALERKRYWLGEDE